MAGSGLEFGDMSATVPLTRQPQIELAAALVPHLLLRLHTYTFSLTPQPHFFLVSLAFTSTSSTSPFARDNSHPSVFGEQTPPSPSSSRDSPDAGAERETRRAETSLVPGKGPQPCSGPSSLCQLLLLSSAHHFSIPINNSGA